MDGDGEVLIARQLIMLLADRSRFEQLEDAYCRVRHKLSPTAALDSALSERLPSGEHEAVAAFISGEGESAQRGGRLPPVHHSLIDGLEDLYEQRQNWERHQRRERMDAADLAADLAADAQLAAAYQEGRQEAAHWLERFPPVVLGRASASPTPTGRRLTIERALEALLTTEADCQARGGDEALAQVAWCGALCDRLLADNGDSGDPAADGSIQARPSHILDDVIGTGPKSPDTTTLPRPLLILHVLRLAPSSLEEEESFTALIEAANGQDDLYDPTDERTVEAMESLLDVEVAESTEGPRARVDPRVRNELWTHMVWGYRVGRYLLTTHGRSPLSSDSNPSSYDASDLVSFVGQAGERQDVADLMSSPDLSAALHYHPLSSTLRRACGGDEGAARALVRLIEDLGFLTAFGAEDVTRGPTLQIDATRPQAVGVSGGRARRHSRMTNTSRVEVGRPA
jgi:hypothetical protein